MEQRPVIGLITQVQEAENEADYFAVVTDRQYLRALREAGAAPLQMPLLHQDEAQLRSFYEQIDGLCLTGGADVDPAYYGEERHPLCQRGDRDRDLTELLLYRWACAEGKPIFGICRGLQLINVAAGGTLYQDLAAQVPATIKHDYFSNQPGHPRDLLVHEVHIHGDSLLGRILEVERVQVNSMHHQGVKRLAPGMTPVAFAPDGVVEAFEAADGNFLLAVQWHPEELLDKVPLMRRLFAALTAAARQFRGR